MSVAVRRAGALRRHRRSRLQADLPGAPRHGPPRPSRRAGPGRGPRRLEPRRAAGPGRGQHRSSTARSIRRRSRSCRTCCATSAATTKTRRPSTACAGAERRAGGPPTTSPFRPACSRRGVGAGRRRASTTSARVVVEKPFGRDLASAEALNAHAARVLPRAGDLPHRPLPGQGAGAEPALLPLRQLLPRADLEPQLRRPRADHHGRDVRRAGPRQVLRGGRRDPRRGAEPPAADREPAGDGGAGRPRHRGGARREGAGLPVDAAARAGRRRARPVPRLPRRGGRGRRLAGGDLRRGAAAHRLVALGRRAVLHPRRQAPAGDRHRGAGRAEAAAGQRLRRLRRRPAEPLPLPAQPAGRALARRAGQDAGRGACAARTSS